MKSFVAVFLFVLNFSSYAQDKENFRSLIKDIIQHDPAFKEIDLQTPLYDAQLNQGFSQLLLPKVSLTYGQFKQSNSEAAIVENRYRIGSLNASLNLFSFGSDWKMYQSSRVERKAQDQRVDTRLLERERDVTALVLNYLKEFRNLEILAKLVDLKGKALDVSRRRYEAGTLPQEDYNKVKLDVSNARGELFVTQQTFNFSLARVKAYGVEPLPVAYPWEGDLTEAKIKELQELTTPVEKLPQFQAAELSESASDYRQEAYRNLMLGKVSLNFSRSMYDFQERSDQWEWRTSLMYTLPLFDGFDQYVTYKRGEVQYKVNQVKKRFEKHQASANQEAEKSNLQVSWQNWIERRDALKLSSKLYNGSLSQFNQGKLSVNELFVDQDRLLRTELIANLTLHQLNGSVLAFCHSRGKAFVRGCF